MNINHCPICRSEHVRELCEKDGYLLKRCLDCETAFVANPPTDSELNKIYSFQNGYQKWYASDGDYVKEFGLARRRFNQMLNHTGRTSGRVLDIGCSVGFFLKVASDAGWSAEGVELSSDTAAIARKRYGLTVHEGRLENQQFGKRFDVVTMWDLIEHVREPKALLANVADLLTPGGHICIATPNIDGLFPKASYGAGKLMNHWPHPEPPLHLFQFGKNSLISLLRTCGFEPIGIVHERIPVSYSFGTLSTHRRSPKRIPYTLVFAPFSLLGPLFGRGDSITVVAAARSL